MPYKFYFPKGLVREWSEDVLEEHLKLVEWETLALDIPKWLSKDDRILESGCGVGRWVFYLRGAGYNAHGVDRDEKPVRVARQWDKSVPIIVGDFKCQPYREGAFDTVLSISAYEHEEEGLEVPLAEIYRILKPGGKLIITVPFLNLFKRVLGHPLYHVRNIFWRLKGLTLTFAEYRFSREEMEDYLTRAGFELLEIGYSDLKPPRCMTLILDCCTSLLIKKGAHWELNPFGRGVLRLLRLLPARVYYSNIMFVCQKRA